MRQRILVSLLLPFLVKALHGPSSYTGCGRLWLKTFLLVRSTSLCFSAAPNKESALFTIPWESLLDWSSGKKRESKFSFLDLRLVWTSKPKQSSNKSEAKLLSLIKAKMLLFMTLLRAGLVLEIVRKRGVTPAEFGYLCLTVGLQLWIKIPQFLFKKLFGHPAFTDLVNALALTNLAGDGE